MERINCFADPDNIWINQGQKLHIAQGECHHVLLAVVALIGDDQRFFKIETLELCQSIFNGYDIRNITGLLSEGYGFAGIVNFI
jgi:hypothetical protein